MCTTSIVTRVSALPFSLSPLEVEIFDLLLDCAAAASSLPPPPPDAGDDALNPFPSPVIRVAGGWVRDKLLGLENDDIDFALDTCTGNQFARLVGKTLIERYGEGEKGKTGHVAVIMANPEQSKHLETATMRVLGLPLDFVDLRQEEYSSTSRIPTITFGTPKSDAERRDFTINALFFNVTTCEVEDFTERGRTDLASKIMRTPLEPHITFLDDPLRVLRLVRFSARFQFSLEQSTRESASRDDVKLALGEKVSRERVGTELEGMFTGTTPDPALALETINELGLLSVVFKVDGVDGDIESIYSGVGMDGVRRVPSIASLSPRIDLRLLYIITLLRPFRNIPHSNKKQKFVTSYIIRESIKWKNSDVDTVTLVLNLLDDVCSVVNDINGDKFDFTNVDVLGELRMTVGLLLKQLKENWITATALAVVHMDKTATGTFNKTVSFVINKLQIDDCWKGKPKLDGKTIIKSLGLPKGPTVGIYMAESTRHTFRFPKKTPDELIELLKEFKKVEDAREKIEAEAKKKEEEK